MRALMMGWVTALALAATAGAAAADTFDDAMKIVRDPAQLATRAADAEKMFKDVVAHDGNAFEAWYNLGLLQLHDGDKVAARGSFTHALSAEPKLLAAKAELAGLDLESPATEAAALATLNGIVNNDDRFQPEARNLLAAYELKHQNWDAAIKHGRNALLGDPDNIDAFLNIAIASFNQKAYDQAGLIATEALQKHPEAAPLHNIMGLVYLQQDDSRQATDEFLAALKYDPGYDDARVNLAALELAYGNFDSALKRFDETLKERPDDVDIIISRAVALRGLTRYDDAAKAYADAKRLAPGNAEIDYDLCILHQQYTQKWTEAKTACEAYLGRIDKTDPKYAEVAKRVKSVDATLKALNKTP